MFFFAGFYCIKFFEIRIISFTEIHKMLSVGGYLNIHKTFLYIFKVNT